MSSTWSETERQPTLGMLRLQSKTIPELFQEFKTRLDPYVQQLRKHNLTQYAYVYGFDERSGRILSKQSQKSTNSSRKTTPISPSSQHRKCTARSKDPTRTDCYANDWYCPLTTNYNDELSETLRKKGHQVWWYTCGPGTPTSISPA